MDAMIRGLPVADLDGAQAYGSPEVMVEPLLLSLKSLHIGRLLQRTPGANRFNINRNKIRLQLRCRGRNYGGELPGALGILAAAATKIPTS